MAPSPFTATFQIVRMIVVGHFLKSTLPSGDSVDVPTDIQDASDSTTNASTSTAKFEELLKTLLEDDIENLRRRRREARDLCSKTSSNRKTIRAWFGMKRLQYNNATGARNPFNAWFEQIKQLKRGSTCGLTDYQFYLKHPVYGPRVKTKFEKKWPTMGKEEKYRLHYLCEEAKEMLAKEAEEVRQQLNEENEEEHQKRVERAEKLMSGEEMSHEASKDPVVQATCREQIGHVAQPMMDSVRVHTDFFVFMIAGRPPGPGGEKFELAVYSSGTTYAKDGGKGLKIHEFRPNDFHTKVLNYFMDFLLETIPDSVPRDGLSHSLETQEPPQNPADDLNMLTFDDDVDPSTANPTHVSSKNSKKMTKKSKGKRSEKEMAKGKTKGDGERQKGKGKKASIDSETEAELSSSEDEEHEDTATQEVSPNLPRRSNRPT
ncbi:hypothetical protein VKT23_013639 [Stygiomarasmius scandens]|uniref:Uncharacterized protein n=1 Tax=Marasmiellus scandens TaxID=2682957 RepID=A0ABR1J6R3_9AGAR